MNREPTITINGSSLNDNQAMTFRVAIESFDMHLKEDGLGEDPHGKRMVELYRKCIQEMRQFIFGD